MSCEPGVVEEARDGCEGRDGCESVRVVNNLHVTVNLELCGCGNKSGTFDTEDCERLVAVVTRALGESQGRDQTASEEIQIGAEKIQIKAEKIQIKAKKIKIRAEKIQTGSEKIQTGASKKANSVVVGCTHCNKEGISL